VEKLFKERLKTYEKLDEAKEWLSKKSNKIRRLF